MYLISKLFINKRMLTVFIAGFTSGLPLALTASTLQAWMMSEKVDLKTIGLFSLVGIPYTLKFLWAPTLDRFVPPYFGRRRGWMILSQIGLILALIGMAFSNPVSGQTTLAGIALLVAFLSATQDIVIDAYKTELLNPEEYGPGAAISNLGYRLAMLFSGAFALILADHLPWRTVYLLMAGTMGIGLITSLIGPESRQNVEIPKTLAEAVISPLSEFLGRKGSLSLLLFIILYKLDVVFALAMMTPFMMSLGFSKTEIGTVSKGFGLFATILGTFLGGLCLNRLKLEKSLWLFGILQGISGICFCLLAKLGHNYFMMVSSIAAESFFSGMGNAAYAAFLMSLCNPKYTATQFALLTSLMALTRVISGAFTGWAAENLGWDNYFLFSIFLSLPSLFLLSKFKIWSQELVSPISFEK